MKKHLLLITIILLLAISVVISILFSDPKEIIYTPIDNGGVGITPERPISPSSLVASRSGQGEVVVRDFLSDQDIKPYDDNTYRIAGENSVDGFPWYEIFYFKNDRTITISLQSTPLVTARALAERELLSRLAVTEAELCALDIRVTVPRAVEEFYSGRNLGLSMCPNSQSL